MLLMGPLALGQIHLDCMLIWEYLPSQWLQLCCCFNFYPRPSCGCP
jgi:hypothetical protein